MNAFDCATLDALLEELVETCNSIINNLRSRAHAMRIGAGNWLRGTNFGCSADPV
jgi:hypothetical protein